MLTLQITKENEMTFKKELYDLMVKYNVDAIYWTCGEDSDMHGVYDEKMIISTRNNKTILKVGGSCIYKNDLLDETNE